MISKTVSQVRCSTFSDGFVHEKSVFRKNRGFEICFYFFLFDDLDIYIWIVLEAFSRSIFTMKKLFCRHKSNDADGSQCIGWCVRNWFRDANYASFYSTRENL